MNPTDPFLILALIAVMASVFFSITIVSALRQRHVKINWFLLRLYLPKYIEQYRRMTKRETGQVGPFYIAWAWSIILLFVFVLCALIF